MDDREFRLFFFSLLMCCISHKRPKKKCQSFFLIGVVWRFDIFSKCRRCVDFLNKDHSNEATTTIYLTKKIYMLTDNERENNNNTMLKVDRKIRQSINPLKIKCYKYWVWPMWLKIHNYIFNVQPIYFSRTKNQRTSCKAKMIYKRKSIHLCLAKAKLF